jgi:hypothetical protein
LYAGGNFQQAGGVAASNIARWTGTQWQALGKGLWVPQLDAWAYAMAVHDDGTGPGLYVGGFFIDAGGTPARHLARWRGSWSEVAGGVQRDPFLWETRVLALQSADLGNGPALYVGGSFDVVGSANLPAVNIARFANGQWTPLGTGLPGAFVTALLPLNHGGKAALLASWDAAVSEWDGQTWSPTGGGFAQTPRACTVRNELRTNGSCWLPELDRGIHDSRGDLPARRNSLPGRNSLAVRFWQRRCRRSFRANAACPGPCRRPGPLCWWRFSVDRWCL